MLLLHVAIPFIHKYVFILQGSTVVAEKVMPTITEEFTTEPAM